MKSVFFALFALACATFVTATPLETRCEACEKACPKGTHFYYPPKQCCLEYGGPPNPPAPPNGVWCPWEWYFHPVQKCCTPKNPPPNPSKPPTCDNKSYNWWNIITHCCEKNPNPPPPQISGHSVPGYHGHGRRSRNPVVHKKSQKKREQVPLCPTDLESCPISGAGPDQFECIDPNGIRACGGCPTLGRGQDCTRIPGALNVSCVSQESASSCVISSCSPGYSLSSDGASCIKKSS